MTRLARHDEIVERMEKAVETAFLENRNVAAAALDALLTAVVELEVAEEHSIFNSSGSLLLLYLEDKP